MFYKSTKLAVFNFNCELLHDRGGNSAENINIRNTVSKHGLVTKHNFVGILKEK